VIDGLIEAAAPIVRSVGDSGRIRYLLHAHTLQEVAPSTVNVIHEVRERLGLHEAMAFSITQQNCASGLLAIDIADKLLEAAGDDDGLALVLMGEKPYTPSAQLIDNTTIMGEAAAACLVAPGGDRDRVLSYASQTLGEYSAGIALDAEALRSFEHRYTSTLAAVIERALERAGATLADATLVLPHNVNRSSWTRYARESGLPLERLFLDNVPRLGHCYCADPFLNLVTACDAGRLSRGDLYVMAAVGRH
jgi:3-oxoacyl-[acyl-carrier-protein] synthase-3